jgi:hypothetical protein
MSSTDDADDIFVAGIAQPHTPLTEHPNYAGSMLTMDERLAYANEVAAGKLRQQVRVDPPLAPSALTRPRPGLCRPRGHDA